MADALAPGGRVLVLGADGFIGRHIAFRLREQGFVVLASARRTSRLSRMGFETLRVDLTAAEASDPAFWTAHLDGVDAVINAAGLLTGSDAAFKAVHVTAPKALYAAAGARPCLLLSAVGIDAADTPFAAFRRAGEDAAATVGILRAGLVLGDISYGGSSLARGLAALPFVTPLIAGGVQRFNPVHASDLADAMISMLCQGFTGRAEIGGPEVVTLKGMLAAYRGWLGLPPARPLSLPLSVAHAMGRIGDAMRMGPISATAVDQLSAGVEATTNLPPGTPPPRSFSTFIAARPAGTQDLWHARLYLARPALRLTLALLWLASGIIGLTLDRAEFLPIVAGSPLPDALLVAAARLGGILDLAIAAALLRGWRPTLIAGVQAAMVAGYTLAFTVVAPGLWLLPLGGLLKNLPILALIALAATLEDER